MTNRKNADASVNIALANVNLNTVFKTMRDSFYSAQMEKANPARQYRRNAMRTAIRTACEEDRQKARRWFRLGISPFESYHDDDPVV